jgi:hypothetical protein
MEILDSYLSNAVAAPDLMLDISYMIHPFFLSEGDKKFSIEARRSGEDNLYNPDIPLFKGFALGKDVHKKERELAKYYASIVKCGKKYNRDLNCGDHYFWLRPVMFRNKKVEFNFPWYDTFSQSKIFLNTLLSEKTGWIFDDLDQGWRFAVFADQENFYFLTGHWEENKYNKPLSVSRKQFSILAKEVVERTEKQIKVLTSEIGKDYWTKRN